MHSNIIYIVENVFLSLNPVKFKLRNVKKTKKLKNKNFNTDSDTNKK